jgi:dipeptidyl aminopeptidase/acylaminoacyl peptidase
LGIAVIAPNVRGSAGYGKTFLKLDNGFNREDSVKDIGKLIEWIESNSDFNKNKIAVFGGSYGGYMVLSSMYNFNDKIKCGVDIVGISNFVTFLENTEEYRRDLRRAEYGDERDPKMREYLLSISPTNHVDKFKAPLFVIQGANDPRVPASESEQMVQSIRKNNGEVWYMLAKDEGHGFRKKENRDRMTEAIALFLKENLLND